MALVDGRVLSGPVRTDGDTLLIGDGQGHQTEVPRAEVEALQPSTVSTMPEGLATALGPERMKDLLTYLMTPTLEPAPIHREGAPPPRTRAEVDAVLREAGPTSGPSARSLRIVLVDGEKDHGVDEHDYPL